MSLVTGPLRLESSAIRIAAALQTELVARLDESGPVTIDGGSVERVDTATLQLLAAFVRELHEASRAVVWSACSPTLRRASKTLGLESSLRLPSEP